MSGSDSSRDDDTVDRLTEATHRLEGLLEKPMLELKLNEIRLRRRYQSRTEGVKVSVIMPTWNRAFILRRAVESVLRQTYRSLELIVTDDGSTDNTEEFIRTTYSEEPRLRYVRTTHRGVSHARNVALECATGDLIAYLDSDNVWSENYLLLMANSLSESPMASTAYCGISIQDSNEEQKRLLLRGYDRESLLLRNYIDLSIFMHRSELLHDLGRFDETLPVLEDWDLILRYTRDNQPLVVECVLATYCFDRSFDHLLLTEDLQGQYLRLREIHRD